MKWLNTVLHWHRDVKAEIAELHSTLEQARRESDAAKQELATSLQRMKHKKMSFDDRIMQIGKSD